jgi:hypothetical protein
MKWGWDFSNDIRSKSGAVLGMHDIRGPRPDRVSSDISLAGRGISFTLFFANGGSILQFRNYNKHNDVEETRLYIIKEDEDCAEQVAKCVTLETLRNVR